MVRRPSPPGPLVPPLTAGALPAAHDGSPSGRGALNVDRWQRVHGHDNLFVLDGSVHVTNGGFNPVLTIMALAWRAADRILGQW